LLIHGIETQEMGGAVAAEPRAQVTMHCRSPYSTKAEVYTGLV